MGSEFAPKAPVSAPKAQERTGPEVGPAEESGPGNAALVSQAGLSGAPPPATPPNGIGDPAPIVSYLQAAVSMGKGDWIVGKLLPVVSKGDMKTIADAYGDGFSQDVNATLTTDQYAVLRGRLIGVIDPTVDLGRRSTWRLGGDLEGVKSTIDDLTPDQLLAFRRDAAALLVFEAKISEVLGGSSLLGNDDLTFEAKRYLDARLASVKDPEAKVGAPDPVAEARYRTAVQRVKGALAAWVGSGPNDALAAIADLDASQRDRLWRDVLSSAFFPDAGVRIVFDQACHAESDAKLVSIIAGFTKDTGGADEMSERVTPQAASRVAEKKQGTAEMQETVGAAYGAKGVSAAGGSPVDVAVAQLPDAADMEALFDILDSLGPMDRIALTDHPKFEARRKELSARETDAETLQAYTLNPSDADAQLTPESPEVVLFLSHVERAYHKGDWAKVIDLLDRVDPKVRGTFKESDRAQDVIHEMICNGDAVWAAVLGPTFQFGVPVDLDTAREVAAEMKGDQAVVTEVASRQSADSATLRASYVSDGDGAAAWTDASDRLGDVDGAERFAAEDVLLGAANPLAADPEQEVRFLRKRLAARLGVEGDVNLLMMQSFSWEGVTEEVTEFYRLDAELGAEKYDEANLSALILQFGEAMRALDRLAGAKDQLASIASNVAAAVAAGVVIAATGGAAAPEVVVALAALSGGTAATVAGRLAEGSTRTGTEMGKDALVGSVNGALAALGAPLASKFVKGASSFGIIAGDAAESGGGGLFAGLIESSIDGAFGGAGGSMLDTALDRSVWDRTVSEVIARFVIAAATGALFGAAGGALGGAIGHGAGALATLAKERGPAVVEGLSRWFDESGLALTAISDDTNVTELAEAWQRFQAGDLDAAEDALSRSGMPDTAMAQLSATGAKRGGGRAQRSTEDFLEDLLTDPNPRPEIAEIQNAAGNPDALSTRIDVERAIWDLRRQFVHGPSREMEVLAVAERLQAIRVEGASPASVDRAFAYLFDSDGIAFRYENYTAWKRLAEGTGTLDDARFLRHEIAETSQLENSMPDYRTKPNDDIDGAPDSYLTRFDSAYLDAHSVALCEEYKFLAEQIEDATEGRLHLTPEELAACDPVRDEGRRFMKLDGVKIEAHPDFSVWAARGTEHVELSELIAARLKLPTNTNVRELIAAVKSARLSDGSLRSGG